METFGVFSFALQVKQSQFERQSKTTESSSDDLTMAAEKAEELEKRSILC